MSALDELKRMILRLGRILSLVALLTLPSLPMGYAGEEDDDDADCERDCDAQRDRLEEAVRDAQRAYNNAVNELARWQRARDDLCREVMPGNPDVRPGPSACTPEALEAYAVRIDNKAHEIGDRDVTDLVNRIRNNAQSIQDKLMLAEEYERQGRAKCSSGRDR